MTRLIMLLATSVITIRAASDFYDKMKDFINKQSGAWKENANANSAEEPC